MILSFAGYSFCKPHSASYALVSFTSAWAHYPAEFLAAVLTNQTGYYSTFAYVSEARRMGLKVLLPDINESRREYWGKQGKIRVGLMQVKGLHEASLERVVAERGRRHFESLDDILWRTNPSDTRLLIKSGGLDSIAGGATRPEMIWKTLTWHRTYPARRGRTGSLFGDLAPLTTAGVPQYSPHTVLKHELETLDLLIRANPLELYRDKLKSLKHPRTCSGMSADT